MWIVADVIYDSDEEAREAERLVRENKLAALSVSLADVTSRLSVLDVDADGNPADWLEEVSKGEIVAVTQLPVPAQGATRIVANPDGTYTAWMVEEGMRTSDRRIIDPGALTWRDPAPLTFSDREGDAHETAVFVGNLANFRRVATALVAALEIVPGFLGDPMLPAVTRPRLRDGRYCGHGAQWGTCHLAFSGCVTPPGSASHYAHARWKEVDGVHGVPVYLHPKGDVHAPLDLSLEEARTWYDAHCSLEGLVEVGEDTFGIWTSGSATAEIDGMFLSGDWRSVDGALELMGFLACDRPAFPLALVASDVQTALVAAGMVTEDGPEDPTLEILSLLKREVVALRREVAPLLLDREADLLLAGMSTSTV